MRVSAATAGRQGRAALLWALLFFIGTQAGFNLLQRRQPSYRDPIFGEKLDLLRQQLATGEGRPLVLFMGSSRAMFGVRPDVVRAALPSSCPEPVVFNFSHPGAGPLMHLLHLKRLLDRGIQPDVVVLEVWSCFLHINSYRLDFAELLGRPLEWTDVRPLRRYAEQRQNFAWTWLEPKLLPCYNYRLQFQQHWAPELVAPGPKTASLPVDELGWHSTPVCPPGPTRDSIIHDFYRVQFEPVLHWVTVSPCIDALLREILSICRERNIAVSLLFLPESQEFQSWYAPQIRKDMDAYLERLSRECAVPWIDARNWVPDASFVDSCHLDCEGAAAFSERFGRDVLGPMLGGAPQGAYHAATREASGRPSSRGDASAYFSSGIFKR